MSVVRKLPEHVINQIKAGEVVERPVSVVKELLENAFDACAQDIVVELIDGGRQLIRITDDGCGMSPEDALMALERHATSKISAAEDLLELSTFGFRGEALPSIAAVSDFTLRTRRVSDATGIEIHLRNGERSEPQVCGMAHGTEIVVRNLFESIPVRRKFLRSTATEYAHVFELIQSLALAYHKVGIRLVHNGREALSFAPAHSLAERFRSLLDAEADDYISIDYQKGSFRLEGFVQRPDLARPVPRHFMTFVNGRLVKDRIVRNGVLSGYTGLVMKGLVPGCALFVSVDPQMVDVNAHPNKTEIRFTDPALVQDLVTIALQSVLKKSTQSEMLSTLPTEETIVRVSAEARRGDWSPSELKQSDMFASPMPAREFMQPSQLSTGLRAPSQPAQIPGGSRASVQPVMNSASERSQPQTSVKPAVTTLMPETGEHKKSGVAGDLLNATYLGQYKNCYLLFESQDDLLVVDQHAFHERILFEELSLQIEHDTGLARQSLLAPVMVPIPQAMSEILQDESALLQQLGFEIEVLSAGRSVALHSLPTQLEMSQAVAVFDDILARVLATKGFATADAHPLVQRASRLAQEWLDTGVRASNLSRREIYHLHLATVACHSAVRSGDPLNAELVRRLLMRACEVDFYAHCPHGRPVWRRWTDRDVAQWFARI